MKPRLKLEGSFPALITPFRNGVLDETAFRNLVRRQINAGSAGLVACGSTGEAATLSAMEHKSILEWTLAESRGIVPVIAGVGTNATGKSIEMARTAASLGTDALLVLSPYYNKPTQEGLFLHFREVARSVDIPVIVYNIPGRTAVNMLPTTLARLAKACPNIIAVKEASGSLDQVSEILNLCPKGFIVLSGDDSLTLPMMAIGARGVISVAANIAPEDTAKLCSSFIRGNAAVSAKLHLKLFPLIKALFLETNPIPVKAAASMMGLCREELRLPLTPITPENKKRLRQALKAYGCL